MHMRSSYLRNFYPKWRKRKPLVVAQYCFQKMVTIVPLVDQAVAPFAPSPRPGNTLKNFQGCSARLVHTQDCVARTGIQFLFVNMNRNPSEFFCRMVRMI